MGPRRGVALNEFLNMVFVVVQKIVEAEPGYFSTEPFNLFLRGHSVFIPCARCRHRRKGKHGRKIRWTYLMEFLNEIVGMPQGSNQ
jgi:hypothetical protein